MNSSTPDGLLGELYQGIRREIAKVIVGQDVLIEQLLVALFAGGLHGYFVTAASHWQRALLSGGGICLVFPGVWTDLAGAGLAAVVIVTQLIERRAASSPAAAPTQ